MAHLGLMLSRLALMVQAAGLDGQFFDPIPPFDDCGMAAKVGISGRDVADALVVAVVVIVIDESADLAFKVSGQVIVFQQDAVFQGLVPTLDLALCLGMIGGSTDMLHAVVFEPVRKIAGDVRRAIVTEQPGFVDDPGMVAA